MSKMSLVLFPALLLVTGGTAWGADDFEAFRQQQEEGMQEYGAEADAYGEKMRAEFEKYTAELRDAFGAYQRQAAVVWGRDARVPDNRHLVEYGKGMRERRVVDFEQGVVRVEVALDPKEQANPQVATSRLEELVKRTVTEAPDNRSMVEIAKAPAAARREGEAALQGVVKDGKGEIVTPANAAKFASQVVKTSLERRPQKGGDGVERVVVSAQFPLIPQHVKVRAERFRSLVQTHAQARQLDPKLVFAIMETESYFNPLSRSSVPAFGLMQLVPASGAKDAYRYLFNEERLVTDTYLYDPKNNIELGAGYLSKIFHTYMAPIRNPTSRLWCTVASYNTGPGNVFRTFAGKYTRSSGTREEWQQRAIARINALTPDEVFSQLRQNLPYEETRVYVQRVRERMPKYGSL